MKLIARQLAKEDFERYRRLVKGGPDKLFEERKIHFLRPKIIGKRQH